MKKNTSCKMGLSFLNKNLDYYNSTSYFPETYLLNEDVWLESGMYLDWYKYPMYTPIISVDRIVDEVDGIIGRMMG